jgi:AraC-like DNA-binding protein
MANYLHAAVARRFELFDVTCCLVANSDWNTWHIVYDKRRPMDVVQFEQAYGTFYPRWQYNEAQLAEARKTRAPVVAKHGACHDLFVPIVVRGKVEAYLVCGTFWTEPPTPELIRSEWLRVAGRDATLLDPAFCSFLRAALDTVVLEGTLLRSFCEFVRGYAKMLAGEADSTVVYKKDIQLHEHALRRSMQMWDLSAGLVDRATYVVRGREFRQWRAAELGIERFPTTVLAAVAMSDAQTDEGAIRALVAAHELQRHCVALAQQFPNTLCGRIGDAGVFFVTDPGASQPRSQTRLRLLDMADKIRAFAATQHGLPVRVGIASFDADEDNLPRRYDEAMLAAQSAMRQGKPVAFYSDVLPEPATPDGPLLQSKSRQLREAVAQGSLSATKLAADQLIKEVLYRSGASIDASRFYFETTLDELVDHVSERAPMDGASLRELAQGFRDRIRQARSAIELPAALQDAVQTLCKAVAAPAHALTDVRLQRAKKLILAGFRERIQLGDVAKAVGFSTGHFSKMFKKHFGIGFAEHVQKLRMERARHLLRTTPLPIGQVSRETGFRSYLYFFEAFRKENGMTPKEFRRRFSDPLAM